jgi:hypothetical protein
MKGKRNSSINKENKGMIKSLSQLSIGSFNTIAGTENNITIDNYNCY